MPPVALVCGRPGFATDAICDYSELLAGALERESPVTAHFRGPDGSWRSLEAGQNGAAPERGRLERLTEDAGAVIVQYNPFSFGRWGFAPWLPLALRRIRRRPGSIVAVMVHESFVPMSSLRWILMGGWQRVQFAGVLAAADVIFVSTEAWADRVTRVRWGASPIHLPVPSNLPDRRAARDARREALGAGPSMLLLATFGTDHPSRRMQDVAAAANAVRGAGREVAVLNLGASAPELVGLDPAIQVHSPGRLPAIEVAEHLAAADLYLASFVQGVSTRRTTLMAALQHGLPVVASAGPETDAVLRGQAAVNLSPVGEPDRFARAARDLALSDTERARAGVAARSLYERAFDWPVVVRRVTEALAAR